MIKRMSAADGIKRLVDVINTIKGAADKLWGEGDGPDLIEAALNNAAIAMMEVLSAIPRTDLDEAFAAYELAVGHRVDHPAIQKLHLALAGFLEATVDPNTREYRFDDGLEDRLVAAVNTALKMQMHADFMLHPDGKRQFLEYCRKAGIDISSTEIQFELASMGLLSK